MTDASIRVGDLVVLYQEPALGVGRLERWLGDDGAPQGRIFLYDSGAFVTRRANDIRRAPAGVWHRDAPPRPPPD